MRVPNSLQEITIEKYIKAINIIENEDVDLGIMLRLLNLFTGKSIEQLMEYPLAELDKNYQHIAKVLNEKPKFQKTFYLDGKEYGFIPNLEQMKSGEYIDLTNNLGKDILASMAVMYRPITRKYRDVYDIEKYNGTDNKEIFKNAPISVYLGAQVFFWNLTNDLLKLIPQFLEKELTAEQIADLERNGVGLSQLKELVENIDLHPLR